MVKALVKPTSKKEFKRLEGKKDDDGYLPLVLRHFEDTVLLSETRRGRGLPGKGSGIVGEGRPIQGCSETRLGLQVVKDAAEWGIALYLGFTKSATQENYLLQLVHHHRKFVRREKKNLQNQAF